MRWILLVALAAASAFAPARAYTPESGFWWSPDWSGVGLQIELQDDFMAVVVYAYDQDGFPMWYTAGARLDDTATEFSADLVEYRDGPCVGCAFQPNSSLGPVGTILIEFDPLDPTLATLTWGLDGGPERVIDIERLHFYLQRPGDAAPLAITKMLGEWNAVLDFTDNPNNDLGIQFYGDVLVADQTVLEDGIWLFEGCRPEDSLQGFCSSAALASTDMAGYYDTSVDPARHVMVVTDTRDTAGNPLTCVLYDVQVGTNHFNGGLDGDFDGADDGGVTVYECGDDPFDGSYDFYPVRGFRSASRTFVEEGTGPSKSATEATAATAKPRTGLPLATAKAPRALEKSEQRSARTALVRTLEQRLGVK